MTLHPIVEDNVEVRVAVDRERGRIPVVYTSGLDPYGYPELAIEPPPEADPPPGLDWPQTALFLCQALLELAGCVIDQETVEVRPLVMYRGEEGVRFRVRYANEAPGEATALLAESGEVRGVTCSWWSA